MKQFAQFLIATSVLSLLVLVHAAAQPNSGAPSPRLTAASMEGVYLLSWNTPGISSLNSIPLGNGDCAVNAWVDDRGDLLLYLAKSDAWSENGRLQKLGRIRIAFTPSPFGSTTSYAEVLSIVRGMLSISAGTGPEAPRLDLRVDANHPAVVATVTSPVPLSARVSLELWRTAPRALKDGEEIHSAYGVSDGGAVPVVVDPDSILPTKGNRIRWFHRNKRSVWADNLRLQDLDPATAGPDPLLGTTSGGIMEGTGLIARSDSVLVTRAPSRTMRLVITLHTAERDTRGRWLAGAEARAAAIAKAREAQLRAAHEEWWASFWERSYIIVSSEDSTQRSATATVTRGYALQRYMLACAGRGAYPIKFNGSLFTVDTYGRPGPAGGLDADFRRWGGPYWFQNTRLAYWPMLAAGDLDLMKPLFTMYAAALPLRRAATKRYYGHEGAYFPETMNFWGTYTNTNYGTDRTGLTPGLTANRYIRYHWNSGLELSLMMLDHYAFRPDRRFVQTTLLPVAADVLRFFGQHWPRTAEGIIRFAPSQALETYQDDVVDPMPDVAGVRVVASRMLALPDSLTTPALRDEWRSLLKALPALPLRIEGADTLLAPAARYGKSGNIENPELYAIFPYRIFGVEKPGLQLARRSFAKRVNTENGGWQQHSIQAAILGLTNSAMALMVDNFSRRDTLCRFPAFWGPNYDWTPDQDHGSVAMLALQNMVLQEKDGEAILLPAWPANWDVAFRLHASGNSVITGLIAKGKMQHLDVTEAD